MSTPEIDGKTEQHPTTGNPTNPRSIERFSDDDRLLTSKELANRLGLSDHFMRKSRMGRCGPPFLRLGRNAVRYSWADVQHWLSTSRVETTAR